MTPGLYSHFSGFFLKWSSWRPSGTCSLPPQRSHCHSHLARQLLSLARQLEHLERIVTPGLHSPYFPPSSLWPAGMSWLDSRDIMVSLRFLILASKMLTLVVWFSFIDLRLFSRELTLLRAFAWRFLVSSWVILMEALVSFSSLRSLAPSSLRVFTLFLLFSSFKVSAVFSEPFQPC